MSFLTSLGYDYEYYVEKGDEFISKENFGEARIEYLKAYEICLENVKDTKILDDKIAKCNVNLAMKHIEWGKNYEDSESYLKAISSYNQAIELLKDETKRKELKKIVSKLLEKNLEKEAKENACEYIERGDDFIRTNDILDAFTEYKQAYHLIKDIKCELTIELKEKLSSVEKKLVQPYIESSKKAFEENDIENAKLEISYANALIDEFNKDILNEVNELNKKIDNKLSLKENTDKEYVSNSEWDKAIADYRKALELYLAFDYKSGEMLTPLYVNKYEKMYFNAKNKLGELYIKRAEGFFNDKNYNIAERIFVEAKKYFTVDSDKYKKIELSLNSIKEKK